MISEISLSRGYASFWNEFFPWLSQYSQTINRDLLTRLYSPLAVKDDPKHRSINNIIAFTHYRNILENKHYDFERSVLEGKKVASRYPRNNLASYVMTSVDERIINFQVTHLTTYYGEGVVIYPSFPGCGVLASCSGDILRGTKLVEVKAGDRRIVKSDLKQLIVYCALNWLNKNDPHSIEEVELFNPRQGARWTLNLRVLVNTISDFSLEEIFESIGTFLSDMSNEITLED
jgi:hypothetical protein